MQLNSTRIQLMSTVFYHSGRFPPEQLELPRLLPRFGPAAAALARYDALLDRIPNPKLLLAPLVMREAVLSSRIEGTQTTMGEVLQFEAGQAPASQRSRDDINEVLNYRKAMGHAEQLITGVNGRRPLPLCERVLKAAHQILMQGVRGANKQPGEYRRTANWIGESGCERENARFVPIDADRLPQAMAAWERYIHSEAPDQLVQLAILHAEFEALHPFLDGNGRLGRMLVPLFLWQVGLIRAPVFYISAYLDAHRDAYYNRLLAVSRDDDWTGWCYFFLEAIQQQAEDNLSKAQGILNLYDALKDQVIDLTHSQYAIPALDWIFKRPIFKSTDFVAQTNIPAPTARRILKCLRDSSICITTEEARGRRTAILAFPAPLNITEGHQPV